MSRLSHLLTLTPRETWRIARHRLPLLRGGAAWTAEELLSSPKHSRGIRFAELLLRQEAVVRRVRAWAPLDFAGRHVVEVGCGPLAGYGPLAIFCGASAFSSAEPEWDAALFHSSPVRDKYLRVFHADLVALYGPLMSFDRFLAALDERMRIETCGFERANFASPVDIVLSQSVLEHVFPLDATVAKLAAIQSPDTRFLHLVDFGNHYPTANPFAGLYEQPVSDYIARRGKAINGLRMPDVAAAFALAGVGVDVIPSRVVAEGYTGDVHDWWRQRYDDAALWTQLALVAGPKVAA
ncbi:MAG: hypothetical protein ACT4N2_02550 [Hyphomicrobium sp.]